ncbi:receptor kinase-like protein Xa21 [Citrus clementina]|uniref:receptor kinase-like protein Xa21 n=1 Tax=Citrus clementina TaxID=85681 RepID=UPI000CED14BD|nr:receptor kinase-like protein Xa21 [Citrus x clementina]
MTTRSLVHCLLLSLAIAAAASNITTDQQSLLALKAHISYDPTNLFAKNWTSSTSVCSWIGITCGVNSHKVIVLNISGFNLQGTIPPQLGNLSSLETLDLSHNKLSGNIPSSIFNMHTLKLLDFRDNQLFGSLSSFIFNMSSMLGIYLSINRFSGELPANICKNLPNLKKLLLGRNMFHGKIPSTLSKCKQLEGLYLRFNNLSGAIPKEIGNLTKLKDIILNDNELRGEIPQEMGNLPYLVRLTLATNNLVGVVPFTIFNMSTLKKLSLLENTLWGSLPSRIDLSLPNVEFLNLGTNRFSGNIPSSITNASKLTVFQLRGNSFSGLFRTQLKIRVLILAGNPLDGILPSSIGNLSISLERFQMFNCRISGKIPQVISNLSNLLLLDLGGNKLTGSIPVTFSRLLNLQGLCLAFNKLARSIPDEICHLAKLDKLILHGNKFSGAIPSCSGNLTSLRALYLGSNRFTSALPSTIWNLKDILFFDVSSNSLDGPLSLDIGNLKVVIELNLSRNNLSGDIPITIGGLKNLQKLFLANNRLEGLIPESFSGLSSLEILDLSKNKISGVIPTSLEKLLYLKKLNLSFNKLEGEIPRGGPFANLTAKSFLGNELLCGLPDLHNSPCKLNKPKTHHKSRKMMLLLVIALPLSTAALIIVVTLTLKWKLIRCWKSRTGSSNDGINSPQAIRRFSYHELLQATDRFSKNNLLGIGSFGSVYVARLQDGMEVAVKVFHQRYERALKSFQDECEVMKRIRHRNLVKIISACSNDDFKALIMEYTPNGSLENRLYSGTCMLDIFQRLNIMIDVALALEYLHFGHSTPIIHCDLKPSNVLLDEDMVAHISDFSIAKFLNGQDQLSMQTQTLATIGYMAPEYGVQGRVSTRGDVYSYGIMLMETFTGKKPTDEIFIGELSLSRWVNDLLPISVMEVIDTNLLSGEERYFAAKEQSLLSILNLATECTIESPGKRINAREIVTGLLKIRDTLVKSVGMVRVQG